VLGGERLEGAGTRLFLNTAAPSAHLLRVNDDVEKPVLATRMVVCEEGGFTGRVAWSHMANHPAQKHSEGIKPSFSPVRGKEV